MVENKNFNVRKYSNFLHTFLCQFLAKRYYEQCWSEGTRTDADPFYVPFLEKKKNYNIKLGDWEFADDGPWFEHNWSGEKFSQKRVSHKLHLLMLKISSCFAKHSGIHFILPLGIKGDFFYIQKVNTLVCWSTYCRGDPNTILPF